MVDVSLEKPDHAKFSAEEAQTVLKVLTKLYNNGMVSHQDLAETGLDIHDISFALSILRSGGCELVVGDMGVHLVRLGFAFVPLMLEIMLSQEKIDISVRSFVETGSTNDEPGVRPYPQQQVRILPIAEWIVQN